MPINVVQQITSSAAGGSALASATPAVRLNQYGVPFNVGFGVYVAGSGDVTAHVEHTFDEEASAASFWFDHVDVSAGTTVSASSPIDGNYAFPIGNVRLQQTAVSGTPTVTFRVLQTGH